MARIMARLKLDIVTIEDDPQAPGVFALARKSTKLLIPENMDDIPVQAVTING